LACPEIHSSTAQAYAALGRKPASESSPETLQTFQQMVWTGSGVFKNDFQEVVFRLHPHLKLVQRKLLQLGAAEARMSGSGSSIFGIFEDRAARDRAAETLRSDSSRKSLPRLRVYPVTMVSRSRYHALWRRQLAAFGNVTLWPPQDRYAK